MTQWIASWRKAGRPVPAAPKQARLPIAALVAAAILTATTPLAAVVGVVEDDQGEIEQEINLNWLLGAERFYDAGYLGAGVIQANIEISHLDRRHHVFHGDSHVTELITADGSAETGNHATGTAHVLGGRGSGPYPENVRAWGIAGGAELWSGSIDASSISHDRAIAETYDTILRSGIDGRTADVFNSSWGIMIDDEGTDHTGSHPWTLGIDAMVYDSQAVGVISAGNDGAGSNTVNGAASGYNTISVGALEGPEDDSPYTQVTDFSSRGPNAFYDHATDAVIPAEQAGRAVVDITAPGTQILAATGSDDQGAVVRGTSFAAPFVAGGASLMVQAGNEAYADNPDATDGRVIKAALLNSARKPEGWDNGQAIAPDTGVITTEQAMDWAYGTGILDLDAAYDQYMTPGEGGRAGTADLSPSGSGDLGDVAATGWDLGSVQESGYNDYFIDSPLSAGLDLTATLTWFAERDEGSLDLEGATDVRLADLDLHLFEYDPGDRGLTDILDTIDLVASSISDYNTVEHLNVTLEQDGYYGLRVEHDDWHWNDSGDTSETYGLAWTTIPAPGSGVIVTVMALAMLRRHRRG